MFQQQERLMQRQVYNTVRLISLRRRHRARRIWVIPRSQDWWHLLINNWTDREFLFNLRMRRGTFQYLCGMLRPLLTRQHTRYRRPLSVEIRVAVCLWRLATNLEYRSISHLFGVGISTCCLITQEVITAINTILKPMYLKIPSPADFKTIIQAFRDKWRFPQVAGAIDGTHIPIKAPRDTPADYYNRKGQYSVILQAVVHHNMKFWDVNIGQPGRVHDARVLALSSLFDRMQRNSLLPPWTECFEDVNVPLVILGDAAYPLLPWLMKPFPESRGVPPDQINFNHRLSQARMVVERAFGQLKDSHISLVSQVTSACCVLHNFYTSSSSSGGTPRRSQASRETSSLQRVLGLPRGLLPVGHARNTSPGRRPGGIRNRCPSHLSWHCGLGGSQRQGARQPDPRTQSLHSFIAEEIVFFRINIVNFFFFLY
uniref:DDE Tnp4 domain-containing protein n=1 Tax=Sphaeramia orbicularis TaxID=375764 RepID=A0A672Z6H4_9TELE